MTHQKQFQKIKIFFVLQRGLFASLCRGLTSMKNSNDWTMLVSLHRLRIDQQQIRLRYRRRGTQPMLLMQPQQKITGIRTALLPPPLPKENLLSSVFGRIPTSKPITMRLSKPAICAKLASFRILRMGPECIAATFLWQIPKPTQVGVKFRVV